MKRREFLVGSILACGTAATVRAADKQPSKSEKSHAPLPPPTDKPLEVAILLADGATVIDFAGPWEVFQDVMIDTPEGRHVHPFNLSTVAATTDPIRASGGMRILPDYSFDDLPFKPQLVVVPALRGTPVLHEWLAKVAPLTDMTLSVCTGAFQLARAGLLDGKPATTHHDFFADFAEEFPAVQLQRGPRFVDNGNIATAGGLTSGIDLALHVVARYFGQETAMRTATYMEYQGSGWQT